MTTAIDTRFELFGVYHYGELGNVTESLGTFRSFSVAIQVLDSFTGTQDFDGYEVVDHMALIGGRHISKFDSSGSFTGFVKRGKR